MSDIISGLVAFFFVAAAMGGCVLVGSLLFDLLPVLRDGDDRLRQPLVFPEVSEKPVVRAPANVYRIAPAGRVALPVTAPLRAAA
ncbi:hypothetical protein [Croceicoccus pelagius]|uniref:Uncharacterized protein n=1 Tax=Croceicoccus pelagius TaxID=1703341 RepID=A0A917DI27_9SPHN|nr:hypothetical protein [Croceicoccus pelagius]GGD39024.1 hypothetical protein GCM10010989_11370 [Croceicoccus pelagius]